MDNHNHKSEVLDLISSLMSKIDLIPCHPKNKLLFYHCFVLSKVSWHFTIASRGKTWIAENLDNLVSSSGADLDWFHRFPCISQASKPKIKL